MILIDTNIAVSLWIDNDWTESARRLFARDPVWSTEAYALIEFSNVMRTYVRAKLSSAAQARKRLEEAERFLYPNLVEVAHFTALETALEFGISAYDARFLAAARDRGMTLVTEDAKLRRAAPKLTQSLAEATL